MNGQQLEERLVPSVYSNGSNHFSSAGHIFEKLNLEMEKLGYECKSLRGGKIDHNSKDKKIRVIGLSTVCASPIFLQILLSLFCFSPPVVWWFLAI